MIIQPAKKGIGTILYVFNNSWWSVPRGFNNIGWYECKVDRISGNDSLLRVCGYAKWWGWVETVPHVSDVTNKRYGVIRWQYEKPNDDYIDCEGRLVTFKSRATQKKIPQTCKQPGCPEPINPYAEPNQPDGSFICYSCRNVWRPSA